MKNVKIKLILFIVGCLNANLLIAKETPNIPDLSISSASFDKDALNITAILSDKDGNSYFEHQRFSLKTQQSVDPSTNLGRISDVFPLGNMVYRESLKNSADVNWHKVPVPNGRLIIYITGKYQITVGSPKHPESRIFRGGDILYFNDPVGAGHMTQVLEDGVALMYDFLAPITVKNDIKSF